ncbi:MAG: DUF1365 domain-containing protein [Deltaproteobacteria bacterium]|nr:DUF1365 domain-containing protein [Deltaproteobacteria bacterium]
MRRSALYPGEIVHTRRDSIAKRKFHYPVFVASIDLAELPALDRELRLFSHGGRNLYALHDRDYAGGAAGLASAHASLLGEHGIPAPAQVRLITNLRVAGYVFNPVSFFLGYASTGALISVVAEVNNTYGGRHRYVLGPEQRIASTSQRIGFRTPRELYVSPFLHGDRTYELWFDAPIDGDALAITMHVDTLAGERVFVAHLAGRRRALTDRALLSAAVRYPLMSLQVIGLIHLEAMKLRFLHRVPYRRPGADHRPLAE